MTALKDRFWAKVLFSQFIRHYRKMTPEQKVADIDASMDALEDLDDTGDSFGAKMVRWSMERVNQYPQASENGKKGGRPRKNQDTTADGDTREDSQDLHDGSNAAMTESPTSANNSEARESQGRTGADSLRSDCHSAPVRLPTFDEFTAFIDAQGLDYTDAREWWEMTMVDREGNDRDGKPIRNWKITCRRFCEAKAKKRRSA
ncbi:MAG: hypothetical protein J6P62_05715 [Bacteroidales bacterium]|nr:hypothetical protein [Bacteroidales bacterium]